METLPLILLVIIVFFVLFGKKIDKQIKEKINPNPELKWLILGVAVVVSVVIGVVFEKDLNDYMIFGVWILMFLIGLTLFIGVIDLFLKTKYFKVPGILTILFIIMYATASLLEKGP